jgi:hypothetical protein
MPSLKQMHDDIADFVYCLRLEPTHSPVGELEQQIRIRTAQEVAMWLESKDKLRNMTKKEKEK